MRGRLQGFARRLWAGEAGWFGKAATLVVAPLSVIYRVLWSRHARSTKQRRPRRVQGIRVVSIGNLAVGGTGKTPLAAWFVRLLADRGETPALVTRGYGRDELLLHARWNSDVPVVADVDRVAATQRALDGGATVAVLDDGFQHERLRRDVDVVLLAAEDDFPGQLLPWGPYREPVQSLRRAHGVIVTRRTSDSGRAEAVADTVAAEFPHLVVGRVHLCAALWQTLGGEPAEAPTGPLLVVTAIAKPDAFRDNVEERTGADVELAWYADHHEYTADEVREIRARAGGRTLVVTAKDAVKFQAFSDLLPDTRVLAQEVRWEDGRDRLCTLVCGDVGRKA